MIRARAGHGLLRPARLLFSLIAAVAIVAACVSGSSFDTRTARPDSTSTSAAPTASDDPSTAPGSPSPSADPIETSTSDPASPNPAPDDIDCTGDDNNRDFFRLAASVMSWPVYCAVLGEGWFLEGGRYELAAGGHLEVTYRGPADAHVAIVEGTICTSGTDIETCAPRDAVIGPAQFGDREAELGRLANGLVLDVDRGATPSWRATGLGLSGDAFRAIGADLILVDG